MTARTEGQRKVHLLVEEEDKPGTFGQGFRLTIVDGSRNVPLEQFLEEMIEAGMEVGPAGPRTSGRRTLATAELLVRPRSHDA